MPWKLIGFLTILVLATFFVGFNLDNRCDVSLVFYTFRDVPIFVSLLAAYVCGSITLIPFFIVAGNESRQKSRNDQARKLI